MAVLRGVKRKGLGAFCMVWLLCILALSAWGESPRTKIRVACDKDYPPYAFLDSTGSLVGIVPDQWKVWSEKTGIPVDVQGYSWSDAIKAFESGETEVLDTVFETPDRLKKYDFTPPYATIEVPVFIHKSISGIRSVADLSGFHIAVKAGDAAIDSLAAQGIRMLDRYQDYSSIVDAAARLDTRIFCIDKAPALYYLYKLGIDRDFRIAFILDSGQFRRAVLKGRPEILGMVQHGFSMIPDSDYAKIDRKWLGLPLSARIDFKVAALVASALVILLLVSIVVAWILRRRVDTATSLLRDKIALLEESESKNQALIEAIPDLIFIFDREGHCLDFKASDKSQLVFPPEAFLGRKVSELGFARKVIDDFYKAMESALASMHIELFYYTLALSGRSIYFEGRVVPFTRDRVLLLARDITELKRKEEELLQSLGEKEILLREIHHRVKNNMQIISSMLYLQSSSFNDENDRLLVSDIQQRIKSMAALHELLYNSPDLSSISFLEYLRILVTELRYSFDGELFDAEVEGSEEIRLKIDDALPLGLIANELVTNALKYAYPGEPKGSIRVLVEKDKNYSLRFSVQDWGVGLPEAFNLNVASSMGFLLVRSLVSQVGAELLISGPPGLRVELLIKAK